MTRKILFVAAAALLATCLDARTPGGAAPVRHRPGVREVRGRLLRCPLRLDPLEGTARGLPPVRHEDAGLLASGDREADRGAEGRSSSASRRSTGRSFRSTTRSTPRRSRAHIRSELLDLETLRNWERNPMMYSGISGLRRQRPDEARLRAEGGAAPLDHRETEGASRRSARPAKANVQNPPKEFTTLAIRMSKGSAGFLQGGVAAWAKDAAGGGRGAAGGVHRRQRQGGGRSLRIRRLAREGPRAPLERKVRHRRGELRGEAPLRRPGGLPARPGAGHRRGESREGLCRLRRDREEDRPVEDARRGHEVDLRRSPDAPRT